MFIWPKPWKVFKSDDYKDMPQEERKIWGTFLKGKFGEVCYYGSDLLRVDVYPDHTSIQNKVSRLLGKVYDYSNWFVFDPESLNEIGNILRLRKKKQLSPETIQKQLNSLRRATKNKQNLNENDQGGGLPLPTIENEKND